MQRHQIDALTGAENEAAVVATLAAAGLSPADRIIATRHGKVILARNDNGDEQLLNVEEEARLALSPGRIVQTLQLETEESLKAYLNGYAGPAAILFASMKANQIVAVCDYHEPLDGAGPSPDVRQGHGGHVATLDLPFSLEWTTWTGVDGRLMPQLEFVRFLEENLEDIRSPEAADVIEACRDLQALRRVDFRSVVREDSDNYRIEYADDTDARTKKDDLTLPAEFVLSIPVYFGGPEVEVHALLRWKLEPDEGKLTLGLKLKRAERIRQAEFQRVATSISEDTSARLVYGARTTG